MDMVRLPRCSLEQEGGSEVLGASSDVSQRDEKMEVILQMYCCKTEKEGEKAATNSQAISFNKETLRTYVVFDPTGPCFCCDCVHFFHKKPNRNDVSQALPELCASRNLALVV